MGIAAPYCSRFPDKTFLSSNPARYSNIAWDAIVPDESVCLAKGEADAIAARERRGNLRTDTAIFIPEAALGRPDGRNCGAGCTLPSLSRRRHPERQHVLVTRQIWGNDSRPELMELQIAAQPVMLAIDQEPERSPAEAEQLMRRLDEAVESTAVYVTGSINSCDRKRACSIPCAWKPALPTRTGHGPARALAQNHRAAPVEPVGPGNAYRHPSASRLVDGAHCDGDRGEAGLHPHDGANSPPPAWSSSTRRRAARPFRWPSRQRTLGDIGEQLWEQAS